MAEERVTFEQLHKQVQEIEQDVEKLKRHFLELAEIASRMSHLIVEITKLLPVEDE